MFRNFTNNLAGICAVVLALTAGNCIVNYFLIRTILLNSANKESEPIIATLFILHIVFSIALVALSLWGIKCISKPVNRPVYWFLVFILFDALMALIPITMSMPAIQAINWHVYFHLPQNNLHYRDVAVAKATNGQKKILVMGDSFTYGNGIEFMHNRFDRRLQQLLLTQKKQSPISYYVNTAADQGWGTGDELKAIKAYSYKPDILIWQYYENDLESADPNLPAKDSTLVRCIFQQLPFPAKIFSTVNLCCFVAPFLWVDPKNFSSFDVKQDSLVKRLHKAEIDKVINYCTGNKIDLIFLPIPNISSNEQSAFTASVIIPYLQSKKVKICNPVTLFAKIPARKRKAGFFDEHASEICHEKMGDLLYEQVLALPKTDSGAVATEFMRR